MTMSLTITTSGSSARARGVNAHEPSGLTSPGANVACPNRPVTYGLTSNIPEWGHWNGWREFAPEDEIGEEPMLELNEAARLNLDDVGAGAPAASPAPGETYSTGQDRKICAGPTNPGRMTE